jgi:60 kDa SS-A/Ro ribonucleoprotein
MSVYEKHYLAPVPQNEKAHEAQAENNAKGFSFVIDPFTRLRRFLILGAEGGTYYVKERKLVLENAKCVEECLALDGAKTVQTIIDVSLAGRAPKQSPTLFALAICCTKADLPARKAAFAAISKVCRTGSHLQEFTRCLKGMRSFGSGVRKAYGAWYNDRTADQLAYQVVKYQQRGGMSHRDILRMARVTPKSEAHNAALRWACGKELTARQVHRTVGKSGASEKRVTEYADVSAHLPKMIEAYEQIKAASDPNSAAVLIAEHKLTHEMVPSQFLDSPVVWDALLQHMPITATIRNLGRMTKLGLIAPLSSASKIVNERLNDLQKLKKGRVHPLNVLVALNTYQAGKGFRSSLTWTPDKTVIDALDECFYLCFDAVEPTNKRRYIALDISGSMWGPDIAGMAGISPRVGSAAMAMVAARTEKQWCCYGFTARRPRWGACIESLKNFWAGPHNGSGMSEIDISAKMRLDSVVKNVSSLPMGDTDCALPMLHAAANKIPVDCFEIYTDSETWAGDIHPHVALELYRQKMSINAKLVVVGMVSSEFSIADPRDARQLDVVGFDTAVPAVMADFIRET